MTLQALRAFFKFPHSTCSARHFSSTSIRSPGSASGRLRHGMSWAVEAFGSCFPKPTKTIQNLYMMFSSHKGFSGHRGPCTKFTNYWQRPKIVATPWALATSRSALAMRRRAPSWQVAWRTRSEGCLVHGLKSYRLPPTAMQWHECVQTLLWVDHDTKPKEPLKIAQSPALNQSPCIGRVFVFSQLSHPQTIGGLVGYLNPAARRRDALLSDISWYRHHQPTHKKPSSNPHPLAIAQARSIQRWHQSIVLPPQSSVPCVSSAPPAITNPTVAAGTEVGDVAAWQCFSCYLPCMKLRGEKPHKQVHAQYAFAGPRKRACDHMNLSKFSPTIYNRTSKSTTWYHLGDLDGVHSSPIFG